VPQFAERGQDRLAARHRRDRPRQLAHGPSRVAADRAGDHGMGGGEQVTDVDDPDDVVDDAAEHRVAGVWLAQDQGGGLAQGLVGFEKVDLGAGHHDLSEHPIGRGEGVGEQPALIVGQGAGGTHHVAELRALI
jgi:hypothetical protein